MADLVRNGSGGPKTLSVLKEINQAQKGANKRSKHIRIHQRYIWEQIHIFKRVVVLKVDTKYNPADLQTKPLNAELYNRHTRTIRGERDCFVKFGSGD